MNEGDDDDGREAEEIVGDTHDGSSPVCRMHADTPTEVVSTSLGHGAAETEPNVTDTSVKVTSANDLEHARSSGSKKNKAQRKQARICALDAEDALRLELNATGLDYEKLDRHGKHTPTMRAVQADIKTRQFAIYQATLAIKKAEVAVAKARTAPLVSAAAKTAAAQRDCELERAHRLMATGLDGVRATMAKLRVIVQPLIFAANVETT